MNSSKNVWSKAINLGVWLLGIAAIVGLPFMSNRAQSPELRTFDIRANRYAYSPSQLAVRPGDIVQIRLTSEDVVHGLYIDGYGVSVSAEPGKSSTVTFIAGKSGSFRIRCNVPCGNMHPFMLGKLLVGGNVSLWQGMIALLLGVFAATTLSHHPTEPQQSTIQIGGKWS